MSAPQTYKNHTRFHPPFHFFVAPVLLLNVAYMIYRACKYWPRDPILHIWWIILSIALLLLAGLARRYALQDQDRIIRLEEHLRLATLVPRDDFPLLQALTTKQIVALRFASDPELPALARRAVAEQLTQKQIKQSITLWRSDTERV